MKKSILNERCEKLSVCVPSVWCRSSVTSHPPVLSTHAPPLSTPPHFLLPTPYTRIGGLLSLPLSHRTHAAFSSLPSVSLYRLLPPPRPRAARRMAGVPYVSCALHRAPTFSPNLLVEDFLTLHFALICVDGLALCVFSSSCYIDAFCTTRDSLY